MISLSLLLTSHLRIFQHPRVRSSTVCYHSFNLLKSRSPPLRVYCQQLGRTFRTRFPFASVPKELRLVATDNNSQTHYAKGKRSPGPLELRSHETGIPNIRYQIPNKQALALTCWYLAFVSLVIVHGLKAQWTWLPHIVCNRFQVLFHSLNKGSFHRSLAVLVHYRLPTSI